MYQYIYINAKAQGLFIGGNHRELIDEYSKEGWRFVAAIPTNYGMHGQITEYDLVFEKEIN